MLHDLRDTMNGHLLEIRQIHRNLRLVASLQVDTHGLYEGESTTGKANGFGNAFCDSHVRRVEVDVIGNQKLSRPDNGRASGGMDTWFSKVWKPIGRALNFLAQPLELATPDVLQLDPFWARGSGLVEINRN